MSLLSKEDILNPKNLKTLEVDVPELGGTVLIREMTGAERDALEGFILKNKDNSPFENIRARFVAYSIVDEQGNFIFSPDEIEALGKVSWRALERIRKASDSLNAITKEDIEELRKN